MDVKGEVKTLFFVKNGSTNVHVTFNKDSFIVGETAIVDCQVDNTKCEKEIRCIKLKLRRIISANDGHGHKFTYDTTIIKKEFHGVPAKRHGNVRLEAVLDANKDHERFRSSLPKECHG